MRAIVLFLCLTTVIGMTVVLAGCGGNASPATTATPAPSPATPAPTPTPPSSGAPTQFMITVSGSDNQPHGQLTVDTAGDVHLSLTSAAPGTYTVGFMSFNSNGWSTPEMVVGSVIVDASGKANGMFHFPQSGIWVGDFSVHNSSTSYFNNWAGGSAASYMATLEPAKLANAGRGSQLNSPTNPQDPLSSGTVTVTNGVSQITINGAVPNVTYHIALCGNQCYSSGTVQTDGSGNGSASIPIDTSLHSDIFDFSRVVNNTAFAVSGFDGGFKVP